MVGGDTGGGSGDGGGSGVMTLVLVMMGDDSGIDIHCIDGNLFSRDGSRVCDNGSGNCSQGKGYSNKQRCILVTVIYVRGILTSRDVY